MPSFFEKLKKGMSVEEPIKTTEETTEEVEKSAKTKSKKAKKIKEEKAPETKLFVRPKKLTIKTDEKNDEEGPKEKQVKEDFTLSKEEFREKEGLKEEKKDEKMGKWFEPEGQLAIDVYQTEDDLVIQSAIAGVKPGNIDITMERDVVIIKGFREKPVEEKGDYFFQECFWGPFSREIILPAEADPNHATAEMKEGVLIIRIPKILREKKRKIQVRV